MEDDAEIEIRSTIQYVDTPEAALRYVDAALRGLSQEEYNDIATSLLRHDAGEATEVTSQVGGDDFPGQGSTD